MSFFEAADDTELVRHRPPPQPEWLRVPHEVVPTQLAVTAVLSRSDEVAIVLKSVEVYSTGFLFEILAVRNPGLRTANDLDLSADMGRFSHHQSADRFRLGLAYADGREVTNDWPPTGGGRPGEPPPAWLNSQGGSGSADASASKYWAWPIPAEGDVDVVYAWPVRGVDEGRFTLSGDRLREAAAAALAIWPGDEA